MSALRYYSSYDKNERTNLEMLDQYFDTLGLTGGVLLILGIGIVFFLLVAMVLEMRTRKAFPNRKKRGDDEGLFGFGDDDDDQ